jgi:4-hydroxyphenylacetate 3-monooxygenase
MKLLWDCVGTEFGARHELYEINYGGSTEEIRRYALFGAFANGNAAKFKGFAEQCMAEYDLDGWKAPDLVDPDDLSFHGKAKRSVKAAAGARKSGKASAKSKARKSK